MVFFSAGEICIDNYVLVIPKTWHARIKADCTQNYNFMDSLNPTHIVQENKVLSSIVFQWILNSWKHVKTHRSSIGKKNLFFRAFWGRWSGHDALSSRNVSNQNRNWVHGWRTGLWTTVKPHFFAVTIFSRFKTSRYHNFAIFGRFAKSWYVFKREVMVSRRLELRENFPRGKFPIFGLFPQFFAIFRCFSRVFRLREAKNFTI